jgi:hypothetical protein
MLQYNLIICNSMVTSPAICRIGIDLNIYHCWTYINYSNRGFGHAFRRTPTRSKHLYPTARQHTILLQAKINLQLSSLIFLINSLLAIRIT